MEYKNDSEKEMVVPVYGTVKLRRNGVMGCSWDIAGLWNPKLFRTDKMNLFVNKIYKELELNPLC